MCHTPEPIISLMYSSHVSMVTGLSFLQQEPSDLTDEGYGEVENRTITAGSVIFKAMCHLRSKKAPGTRLGLHSAQELAEYRRNNLSSCRAHTR